MRVRSIGRFAVLTAIASTTVIAGCDAVRGVIGALQPDTVRIVLSNQTSYEVDPQIYVTEDDNVPEDILELDSNRLATANRLAAGEENVITLDCDNAGTIGSIEAEAQVFIGISPEAENSPILSRGDEFQCGDEVRFIFEGDVDDFRVSVEVDEYDADGAVVVN